MLRQSRFDTSTMDSIEVPLSVTLLGETRELLSTLRRNRRFGYLLSFTASTQPSEHPLVKEVKSIRDTLRTSTAPRIEVTSSWSNKLLIPADVLLTTLDPFLEVVKSRDVSGIITGVALGSLEKITYRLIYLANNEQVLPQYSSVLNAIVDATSACRFDATDPAADEVVLARIIRIINTVVSSPAFLLLSNASILRCVEACLGIAAGRRRASELLKRTADIALVDIFRSIGRNVNVILRTDQSDISQKTQVSNEFPSVFAKGVSGPAFGYALDCDAFQQHGTANIAIVGALIQLSSRMSDPLYARSISERSLGLQLLSTIIESGGAPICTNLSVKKLLMRDCCRSVLRSLGMFQSPPSLLTLAFTTATQLIHILHKHCIPFLLALLTRVYPSYISGYENVSPKHYGGSGVSLGLENGQSNANVNQKISQEMSNGKSENAVELDPVIREIGLESLIALLCTPGILQIVYSVADCNKQHHDVVNPLLTALGHASKTNRSKRRSKRLRASSSGANRLSDAADEHESDDDDDILNHSGSTSSENLRSQRAATLLCAESILAVVETMSEGLKSEMNTFLNSQKTDASTADNCRAIRKEKLKFLRATAMFNMATKMNKAAHLTPILRECNILRSDATKDSTVAEELQEDIQHIVEFLKETPGLNKGKMGAILGEPDEMSRRVLTGYTETFNFNGRLFTESLRVFLESFRLPGEAQKIDRIVQSFANRYYEQNPYTPTSLNSNPSKSMNGNNKHNEIEDLNEEITLTNGNLDPSPKELTSTTVHGPESTGVLKSADAAYVLSFSVVMLNTDQHNDSIKKRMTLDDFVRNCRGINEREDLPRWFLQEIFDSIAAVEIRMSDEAGIGALTDLLWDEEIKVDYLKEKSTTVIENFTFFDRDIFSIVWEPAIVAANSVMNEATDANSVQRALEGFLAVARCATTFKITLPVDAVIASLCTASTIREGPLFGTVVRFGTDIKAQMASVALAGVSRQCGDWISDDGWQALVCYLLRLHALRLLPEELEKKIGGNGLELVGVEKEALPQSDLVPDWWPSKENTEKLKTKEKPRKAARPNGFLAAILAASIGTEADSEEEEEDDPNSIDRDVNGRTWKVSHVTPHYLRMRSREEQEAQDLARKCIAGCRVEDVIINEAKVLQSSALKSLSEAISQTAIRLLDHNVHVENGSQTQTSVNVTTPPELGILNWSEISPACPSNDSSIITGVSSGTFRGSSNDLETDYQSFGFSQSWDGVQREKDERKAREFTAAFCVDILCELTLQNRDRLHIPWPALHGLIVRIVAPAVHPSALLERAITALLRVGVRLMHREEIRDDLLRAFNLLVRLPVETADAISIPVASGVYNIVKAHCVTITSTSGWHAVLSIIEGLTRCESEARNIGLATISTILQDQVSSEAVSKETFSPLLDAILAYTSCSSVDISIRALELLYMLSQRISAINKKDGYKNENKLSEGDIISEENKVWSEHWNPLLLGFASSVRDPRGKVRNSALGVLERVLASVGSANLLSAREWAQVLSSVVLPLMTQIFTTYGFLSATVDAEKAAQEKLFAERNATSGIKGRGRSFSTAPDHNEQLLKSVAAACNRTRMRAVDLTSKTFLLHHMVMSNGLTEDAFTEIWLGVLEVFRIAIEMGKTVAPELKGVNLERSVDTYDLVEHVPENVKNLLLVMHDRGLLTEKQHTRWNATFAIVEKIIPDIESVFPKDQEVMAEKVLNETQNNATDKGKDDIELDNKTEPIDSSSKVSVSQSS